MNKKIVVGTDNFEKFIRNNGYYVDKTELLYDLVAGTGNEVTLFTRPRRFGKTLTMSMMESFFDISRDSSDLFADCNISKNHPDFCKEWMNQYPVLSLTLKDVEGLTFESAFKMMKAVLGGLCKRVNSVIQDHAGIIDPDDMKKFGRLKSETAELEEVKDSLNTLMRMLNTVYGRPVILLIDEYDVPLAKAEETKNQEFYRQMLDLIRGILSISMKTNDYLKFAVVTGCLRISKESIFTGVNNFACYSVTSRKFSQYFGFTQEEVSEMLDAFGMADKLDLIRQWYDGYIFGNTEVFCPWDVASYLSAVVDDEGEEPRNYWADTSSNAILNDFVNHRKIDASEKFEVLLNGGTITEDISEELTYDHIADSEKNLWSVLLMTGYVSKADKAAGSGKMKLRIPNAEIAALFRDAVVARFKRTLDASNVDAFITAMWNKDEQTASDMLTKILWNSISYFDYGEEYYHGMLNGIFTSRGYAPDSNDEAGLGRLDLRVRDRANRTFLLLEFKRSDRKEDLDSDCDQAIAQIFEKGYDKVVPEGYERQLIYGVAFYAKMAKVKVVK
ncbi:MAG: AAA family ATPase [Lachnospiraceae bacterium]|nr:AAA family ATPase [Lachnospiraceae bacterium]